MTMLETNRGVESGGGKNILKYALGLVAKSAFLGNLYAKLLVLWQVFSLIVLGVFHLQMISHLLQETWATGQWVHM